MWYNLYNSFSIMYCDIPLVHYRLLISSREWGNDTVLPEEVCCTDTNIIMNGIYIARLDNINCSYSKANTCTSSWDSLYFNFSKSFLLLNYLWFSKFNEQNLWMRNAEFPLYDNESFIENSPAKVSIFFDLISLWIGTCKI